MKNRIHESLAAFFMCLIPVVSFPQAHLSDEQKFCFHEANEKDLVGDQRNVFIHDCYDRIAKGLPAQAITLSPKAPATPNQLEALRAEMLTRLKDADSAKYLDVYVRTDAAGNGKICGKVNARNSYGGYVGFQAFYADLADGVVRILEIDSPTGGASAASRCYRIGM